jgi:hypothetical protein
MRNASAKRSVKRNPFTNNPQLQSEDIIFHPINPVNPDSKIKCLGYSNMETHHGKDDAATHRRKEV